jgi:two-component system, LytTR family, response regulator
MTNSKLYQAIIIEDEKKACESLRHLLNKNHPAINVVKACESVSDSLDFLKHNTIDLAFMDICIKNGTSFDILSQLSSVEFKIIFTTAFDEYALRAIKLSALDYLLKPIDADELRIAIQKFIDVRFDNDLNKQQLRLLHDNLLSSEHGKGMVAIPTLDGFTIIQIQDIIRCEAKSNYTDVFLKNNIKFTTCRTLKEYEELFVPHNFFRIHNSHLINLHHLQKYVKGKGGHVVLSDGKELEVSVRKKEEFLNRLGM